MSEETPQEKMERLIDERIVETLEQGEILRGKGGDPILDENGKPIRATPSAAFINAAINRAKSRKVKVTEHDDSSRALAERAGRMPDIDEDGRDMVGGEL